MNEAKEIVATIEGLFAAVGKDDRAGAEQFVCHDFHAFENGVQMSGRELLDLMSKLYAEGKRYEWSVKTPQVEVQGDLGVIAYLNHGFITEAPGAVPTPMSWLESVLLRREKSGWRVAFLHSTRTKAAQGAA